MKHGALSVLSQLTQRKAMNSHDAQMSRAAGFALHALVFTSKPKAHGVKLAPNSKWAVLRNAELQAFSAEAPPAAVQKVASVLASNKQRYDPAPPVKYRKGSDASPARGVKKASVYAAFSSVRE